MGKYKQRADGLYRTSITLNGKRKYLYAKTQKELDKKLTEIKALNYKGIIVDDNKMTVGEWADKWLNTYKNNKEKATINMYANTIRLYIKPELGYMQLKNLKEVDITNMLNKMAEKGITRQKEITLLTIKQILELAVKNDYIYKNVANYIKLPKTKAKEKQPIDDTTINLILENKNNNNFFIILFMLYTGIRKSELVPIKVGDIDLENKTLKINKAVHFENNQPEIKTTKNTCSRVIPILDIIYNDLVQYTKNKNKNDLLFPDKNGKMRSETSMKRTVEYVNKHINQKFSFHQLRHTYACFLYKAGIQLKDAQYFMGHKDIKVLLNIYTHLDNQDKLKSADKLNNFLK